MSLWAVSAPDASYIYSGNQKGWREVAETHKTILFIDKSRPKGNNCYPRNLFMCLL